MSPSKSAGALFEHGKAVYAKVEKVIKDDRTKLAIAVVRGAWAAYQRGKGGSNRGGASVRA